MAQLMVRLSMVLWCTVCDIPTIPPQVHQTTGSLTTESDSPPTAMFQTLSKFKLLMMYLWRMFLNELNEFSVGFRIPDRARNSGARHGDITQHTITIEDDDSECLSLLITDHAV